MIIKLQKTDKPPENKPKTTGNIWWEISAYAIRTTGIVAPSAIIATINHTWVKTSLGFSVTLMLLALFIIYQKPIKAAMNIAPGVIPFAVFLIAGYFFYTTATSLFIIGGSGLIGCSAAIPLHLKYAAETKDILSPETLALKALTEKLDNLNKVP